MKKEAYNRARLEILNYIINHSTITYFGENLFGINNKEHAFIYTRNDNEIPIGSLVKLGSVMHANKYYLSWLKEIRNIHSEKEYLLESIEDHSLCWWSNVSLNAYSLETTKKFKSWKWSDSQFEFNDKWIKKGCKDHYVIKPFYADFNEDGSVTLQFRKIFENDIIGSKTFPDWKKLTIKEMREFYLEEYNKK